MAASASAAFRPCRRRGARASLEDNPNWRVVAEARDGREAVEKANEFAPEVDRLTMDSSAPLLADASGKYPVPQPGIKTKREF